jgi:hypothetical protein
VYQFGKNSNVQGEEIEGILDSSKLYQQANLFGQTMLAQYFGLEKPIEHGAITRLWTNLAESQYLEETMLEYFKLADLCQTMILGSVSDERMFSALSFLKSKLRNKLDKHMDTCLRLYVTVISLRSNPIVSVNTNVLKLMSCFDIIFVCTFHGIVRACTAH